MHSVPVPINVRCYSNSDIIVRRSEVTLRANNDRFAPQKNSGAGDHRRPDYLKAFLDHLVNWDYVAERYEAAMK
jgi:hypothetical protein